MRLHPYEDKPIILQSLYLGMGTKFLWCNDCKLLLYRSHRGTRWIWALPHGLLSAGSHRSHVRSWHMCYSMCAYNLIYNLKYSLDLYNNNYCDKLCTLCTLFCFVYCIFRALESCIVWAVTFLAHVCTVIFFGLCLQCYFVRTCESFIPFCLIIFMVHCNSW